MKKSAPETTLSVRTAYEDWARERSVSAVFVYSLLIVVFLPGLHFLLGLVGSERNDVIGPRLLVALLSILVGLAVYTFRWARLHATLFQLVNVLPALIITDLLVVDHHNDYLYQASGLLVVVGLQQAFYRLRDITVSTIVGFGFLACYSYVAGWDSNGVSSATLIIYAFGYAFAYIPAWLRIRTQQSEIASRLEAQGTRSELQRRMAMDDALSGIGDLAIKGKSSATVAAYVAGEISAVYGFSSVAILKWLPEDHRCVLVGADGWPSDAPAVLSVLNDSQAMRTLDQCVFAVERYSRKTGLPDLMKFAAGSTRITVPIPGPERAFGLISANSLKRMDLTADDLSFLHSCANTLAIVLARDESEGALRETAESLAHAQYMAHLGNWRRRLDTSESTWSDEMYRIFGVPKGSLTPRERYDYWEASIHPADRDEFIRLRDQCRDSGEPFSMDYRIVLPDGATRWVAVRAQYERNAEGDVCAVNGTCLDITARKQAEEGLAYLAHYDWLTELPNRTSLTVQLSEAMERSNETNKPTALLFLDLDRFKNINDAFGHNIGDMLLRAVAQRLVGVLGRPDCIFRWGGDEFLVLLTDMDDTKHVSSVAQQILNALAAPFVVADRELVVTTSIGISVYPEDGNSTEGLIRCADTAMYRAKERGRNGYAFFKPRMYVAAADRLRIEHQLRRAIVSDELVLHYQPILDVKSGQIRSAEALVRWNHPTDGLQMPGAFIAVAEDTGLIIPLGEKVLKEACRQLNDWQSRGLDLKLSFNVSAHQFAHPHFAEVLHAAISNSNVDPTRLEVELTETAFLVDMERTVAILKELGARGVGASLDDFGTGYSSLAYLKALPLDTLKLDRAFIKDIHQNALDRGLSEAVMKVANVLGLSVTVEGVETAEQFHAVCDLGCDKVQGNYISKPLPAELFEVVARNYSQNPRQIAIGP